MEMARSSESTAAFQQTLLTALMHHVGAEVGAFEIGAAGVPTTQGFRRDVVSDWRAARARHASELAPVVSAARKAASVDAQVLGERRVRASRYFAEIVRPHGGRETLYAVPAWNTQPVGCLVLGRCGRLGRFRRRDLAEVDALLPAIAMAGAAALHGDGGHAPVMLASRELEIVDLLRRGFRSREIAGILGTSPNTVRNQIWRAMARLGASTRAELIALCRSDRG